MLSISVQSAVNISSVSARSAIVTVTLRLKGTAVTMLPSVPNPSVKDAFKNRFSVSEVGEGYSENFLVRCSLWMEAVRHSGPGLFRSQGCECLSFESDFIPHVEKISFHIFTTTTPRLHEGLTRFNSA